MVTVMTEAAVTEMTVAVTSTAAEAATETAVVTTVAIVVMTVAGTAEVTAMATEIAATAVTEEEIEEETDTATVMAVTVVAAAEVATMRPEEAAAETEGLLLLLRPAETERDPDLAPLLVPADTK
mmetsp:Transcript_52583/g.91792  ORF Transcript_52583/g.91792 Transcript_52583/m.91792 type:complete len:125 (+) Transcript_52583:351-725(+)